MALVVGDRVKYTAKFCRSIGAYAGDIPHARGVVSYIEKFSDKVNRSQLVQIKWDDGSNQRVLLSNIVNADKVELD